MITYNETLDLIVSNKIQDFGRLLNADNINHHTRDTEGHTLLYWAMHLKRHKIVDLLLGNGAQLTQVEIKDMSQNNAKPVPKRPHPTRCTKCGTFTTVGDEIVLLD